MNNKLAYICGFYRTYESEILHLRQSCYWVPPTGAAAAVEAYALSS